MKKTYIAVIIALMLALFSVSVLAEETANHILTVYFSVAENSEVDVSSAASVTQWNGNAVGTISVLANMIHDHVGGDLYSIDTSVEYPVNTLIDYAADEQEKSARPELINHIENFDQYDTIFIGYPTWWYDLPMVMYSFFDAYDFSGKTIIPFNTHNGSRFSGTIQTIEQLEPNATVIENGFTVNERNAAKSQSDIDKWLTGLGY